MRDRAPLIPRVHDLLTGDLEQCYRSRQMGLISSTRSAQNHGGHGAPVRPYVLLVLLNATVASVAAPSPPSSPASHGGSSLAASAGASAGLEWLIDYGDVAVGVYQLVRLSEAVQEYEIRYGSLPRDLLDLTRSSAPHASLLSVLPSLPLAPSSLHPGFRSSTTIAGSELTSLHLVVDRTESVNCVVAGDWDTAPDRGGWAYIPSLNVEQTGYLLFFLSTRAIAVHGQDRILLCDVLSLAALKEGGEWKMCSGSAATREAMAGSLLTDLLSETQVVASAIERYSDDHRQFPTSLSSLSPQYVASFSEKFMSSFDYDPRLGILVPRKR